MNQASYIQLVTISARENDAALIESHLRDRGQPVRMQWLQATDDLEDRLSQLTANMIFCEGGDPQLRDYAIHCCTKAAPEVPILVLTDEITAEAVDGALQKRARDAVSTQHLDHLQAVYLRELAAAKLESNLREVRAELKTLRARMTSLVSVSQLAVANLQGGILVEPSDDFSALFGYDTSEAISGLPFLELVHPDDRARVKKILSRCANGKSSGADIDAKALMSDGKEFLMHLRVAAVDSVEGSALEIQVNSVVQSEPAQTAVAQPTTAVDQEPDATTTAIEEAEPEAAKPVLFDDAETTKVTEALAANKQRFELHPFITLDGQQSSCSDALLQLQDKSNNWFSLNDANRADSKVLKQANLQLLELVFESLKQAAAEDKNIIILAPVSSAFFDAADELTSFLEEKAKAFLQGEQSLVLSFDEQSFSNDIAKSKALAECLHNAGIRIGLDKVRANPAAIELIQATTPSYACLDRGATQLLVSQGSEHVELGKMMQQSRDEGMHIVAYPLQDAHSMAMLWQRGVNMLRSTDLQSAAA